MSIVSVQPRDVTFTFADSCNCCFSCLCCKKTYAKEANVYVNSRGELEVFDTNKSKKSAGDSFTRAKSHLFESLRQKISSLEVNTEEFNVKAKVVLDSIEELRRINVSHIDRINELMLEHVTSKKASK